WYDPDFHLALRNTLDFVIGVVPITVVLSLISAFLLNQVKIISGFFRTVYFFPFVTSTVAIAMVLNWMFHGNYGLINYFMS
ncbi:sugar ABC transporter permease, partial [Lacticaseibacillus rhamnosus]|uniref:carbohydrate ABC transporter permease n=1 Tax=Lacticaseibacillus rhamnosus TaxID=47715 RepID=UPI0034661559